MSATSTQRLVTAVHTRLSGQLPALVAGADLPAVKEFFRYGPALPIPGKTPYVWMEMGSEAPVPPAAIGGPGGMQSRGRALMVGVTIAAPDAETAALYLEGFADLVRVVLLSDQTAGGEGKGVRWLGTDYSPNLAKAATALLREAILTFEITRWAALGGD